MILTGKGWERYWENRKIVPEDKLSSSHLNMLFRPEKSKEKGGNRFARSKPKGAERCYRKRSAFYLFATTAPAWKPVASSDSLAPHRAKRRRLFFPFKGAVVPVGARSDRLRIP